jgi:glyoxylase-like metal-dependent hydrolase (beta-lactamase superfamily II)/8-oxo-dGTP pyrophosphatase MutT (NUDIX family)
VGPYDPVVHPRPVTDRSDGPPVTPRPAATVVLVRAGAAGLEVLLVRRPPTMAFAPDVHVFPGGTLEAGDAGPEAAALRELAEEAGVVLAGPDRLVSLSRWVTPPGYARRFDTRFYAAELPAGTAVSTSVDEIADHRWIRPAAALAALARGELPMWPPTTTTLQQLEHVASFGEIRARLAASLDAEPERPPRAEPVAAAVVRVELAGAGGVPGQTVNAWLVGRRELVAIDPGDPSEAAVDALVAAAARAGGRIAAICLTHVDPDHAAGCEALAQRTGAPILVGPGGAAPLPNAVSELADGQRLAAGDIELVVHATPGPRLDHVALEIVGRGIVAAGDLVGGRAARAVLGPPDTLAWRASLERLVALQPAVLLPGHGPPLDGAAAVSRAEAPPTGSAGG